MPFLRGFGALSTALFLVALLTAPVRPVLAETPHPAGTPLPTLPAPVPTLPVLLPPVTNAPEAVPPALPPPPAPEPLPPETALPAPAAPDVATPEATPTLVPPLPTATPASGGLVTVPDVVRRTESEARRALEAAGLVVEYPNYQRAGDVPDPGWYEGTQPGAVLSQQPLPATVVPPGTRIHLAVADPADVRPIPTPAAPDPADANPSPPALDPLPAGWLPRSLLTTTIGAPDDITATDVISVSAEITTTETVTATDELTSTETAAGLGNLDLTAGTTALPERVRPAPLILTISGPTRAQLDIPGRLQLDGSPFARANCGVASIAMILAGGGVDYPIPALRQLANEIQPPRSYLDGLAWETLVGVAGQFGLQSRGLYSATGYRVWTFEDVHAELAAGHPVITLVKYQMLPANWASTSDSDHYIVLTGYDGSDFIYNDSAPFTGSGVGHRLNAADLQAAWDTSSLPRSALALIGPNGVLGIPTAPALLDPTATPQAENPPAGLVAHDPGQHSADLPAPVAETSAVAVPTRESPPSLSSRGEALLEPADHPVSAGRVSPSGNASFAEGDRTPAAVPPPLTPWWPVPTGVLTVVLAVALYIQRSERPETERAP